MSEARDLTDDVWAMVRQNYEQWGIPLAIIPWGGDRAIIVTQGACYLAEADPKIGFVAQLMFKR